MFPYKFRLNSDDIFLAVGHIFIKDFLQRFLAFRLPKKATDHTEDTEKDFRRMIKTTPSDFRPQTSDFRPQTSDFRPQTSDFILVEDYVCGG